MQLLGSQNDMATIPLTLLFFLRGPSLSFGALRNFQSDEVLNLRPTLPSKVPGLSEYSYVPGHWGSLDSPDPIAPSTISVGC